MHEAMYFCEEKRNFMKQRPFYVQHSLDFKETSTSKKKNNER